MGLVRQQPPTLSSLSLPGLAGPVFTEAAVEGGADGPWTKQQGPGP